ncbi:MAG TPA: AsmA-like C-terminal region-containing protein [Cyclobacteriaceae bacterium]|nr:AsmA-like C-terminal region-containing protein [Cyclobacteriaceae bacterium]
MKIIKRTLIGFAIFLVVLIAAAFILPVVFKDDIKAAIDKSLAENVNADVVFDVNNFSLSVFSHFPNITAEIKELGVFNRAPFAGEHLFVAHQIDVEINLMDVLFGDKIRIKGITLVRPQINVKVLADGRANYDIAVPSKDTVKVTAEPGKFSIGIDHWEIVDGELAYDDKSIPYSLSLKGLNHTGSGDFTQDQFDLNTHTAADSVSTAMGSLEFLTNKHAEVDAVISISENISKFTFKDNKAKVNDFAMSFDGWFKMNPDNYEMDITFKSPENSFKSLLSIVPGMYTKDYNNLETKGDLSFAGAVKGAYSDKQMPAFKVELQVKDAMFKYPALPTAVNNINVDLLIDNADGNMANTMVDLKNLHLDFGSNPVAAKMRIENLRDYRMNADVTAKLDLAELNKMFPMDGMEMKGLFTVKAKAQGVYDSLRKIIPAVDVTMTLADGYVKSPQLPIPLQDMHTVTTIRNSSGKMAETTVAVETFTMMLDGEKLEASMMLKNLDDYTWDVKAKGGIDLEKMTKIFPLKDMTLAGKVKANLETSGKMSDVTAKRYDKLPTRGSASLRDFKFEGKDLPVVTLSVADATFDPQKIELSQLNGTIGKSDFNVKGLVSNYIGYVLKNETIRGNVSFSSTLLDLNEFMSDAPASQTDTTSFGVIPIPANIDFLLHSSIATVKMMDYTMTQAAGDVTLKNGIASLSGLKFNMLGGAFGLNGSYNAIDVKHPKYDMSIKIENLSVQEAAHSFSMVRTYAPVAGLVNGNFSTDFKLTGELTQKMMPNLGTVTGAGLVKLAQASVTQSKLVAGISSLANIPNTSTVNLKDVLMSATISNGRLSVKPFDVKFGDISTTISGSSGLDQSLDYSMKMMVPAGQLGAQLQGLVGQYTGAKPTDKIPVTIGVGGTFKDPKTQLMAAEQKEQVKEAVKEVVQQKGQDAVQQVLKGDKPADVVNNLLKGATKPDSVKTDSTKAEPVNQLMKLQNLLKKKKN